MRVNIDISDVYSLILFSNFSGWRRRRSNGKYKLYSNLLLTYYYKLKYYVQFIQINVKRLKVIL